jgi:hypothetical protein
MNSQPCDSFKVTWFSDLERRKRFYLWGVERAQREDPTLQVGMRAKPSLKRYIRIGICIILCFA